MAFYISGSKMKSMTYAGAKVKKWIHDNVVVYVASKTLSKKVTYHTHGNTFTLNWDTLSAKGFTKATYTFTIAGTEDLDGIFFVGIGTSAAAPPHTAVDAPAGSIVNQKSTNGSNVGTWTGEIQLREDTTYYVYLGSYYAAERPSYVSATVVFE